MAQNPELRRLIDDLLEQSDSGIVDLQLVYPNGPPLNGKVSRTKYDGVYLVMTVIMQEDQRGQPVGDPMEVSYYASAANLQYVVVLPEASRIERPPQRLS